MSTVETLPDDLSVLLLQLIENYVTICVISFLTGW